MSQRSLIEGKGTSVFAWRLHVAVNCASLQSLASTHAQVQSQRKSSVISSRLETRKISNPDTPVTAAYDNDFTRMLVRIGLHAGIFSHRASARSMRITSFSQRFRGSSRDFLWNQQEVTCRRGGMTAPSAYVPATSCKYAPGEFKS